MDQDRISSRQKIQDKDKNLEIWDKTDSRQAYCCLNNSRPSSYILVQDKIFTFSNFKTKRDKKVISCQKRLQNIKTRNFLTHPCFNRVKQQGNQYLYWKQNYNLTSSGLKLMVTITSIKLCCYIVQFKMIFNVLLSILSQKLSIIFEEEDVTIICLISRIYSLSFLTNPNDIPSK